MSGTDDLLVADSHGDVLEAIESDPDLKRLPVIVLAWSKSDEETIRACEEHATARPIEPIDPDEFADLARAFAVSGFPPRPGRKV